MAETEGFVDSALIHGALATLSLGGGVDLSAWDRQSLLEITYLLLFRKIGIVPGPGGYRGASGPFERVISQLPALQVKKAAYGPGTTLYEGLAHEKSGRPPRRLEWPTITTGIHRLVCHQPKAFLVTPCAHAHLALQSGVYPVYRAALECRLEGASSHQSHESG